MKHNYINEEATKELNLQLTKALIENNFEEAQKLIDQGADINEINQSGQTRLIEACYNNNPAVVKFLIKNEAFLAKNDGLNALGHACWNGHFDVAQLLVDKGVNINKTNDKYNQKLLSQACFSDNPQLVEFLIKNGAPTRQEENLIIELNNYLRLGKMQDAESLIENIDISKREYDHGLSLFSKACRNGNFKLSKFFIDNGALKQEDGGIEDFQHACWSGHLDVAQLLIDNGVEIKNNSGENFLRGACYANNFNRIKFLVDNGVEINAQDYSGDTLLHIACSNHHNSLLPITSNQKLEMLEFLIKLGGDMNLTNNYGVSPFQTACLAGDIKIVEYLFPKAIISKKDFTQLKLSFPNDYKNIFKEYFNATFSEAADLAKHDKDSKETEFTFLASFKIWRANNLKGIFPKPLIAKIIKLAGENVVKDKILSKFNIFVKKETSELELILVNDKQGKNPISKCENFLENIFNSYILDGTRLGNEETEDLVELIANIQN
jgi:ankyrin repeat protein